MCVGGGNPYQTPQLFLPVWPTDSAYRTGPVTASYCPETPPTSVTAKKTPVSFADDDVVISPSGTVDPAKIDDEDRNTVVETCSESSDEFVTALPVRQKATSTRLHRRMLPRRRDREKDESPDHDNRKTFYIGESDNDDLSYRRTGRSPSNTVHIRHTKRLHEEKYFTDTPRPGKYSTRNRQLSPQYRTGKTVSHSPKSHKQIVTARSSDKEPRTSRQLRTPVTTDRKAEKSDLSPRTHKKGVSPRVEKSPARRPRTDSPDKTVKIDKHGKNYRQFPFTDRTESLSPDRRQKTVHHRRKDNGDSDNFESSSSSETDIEEESPVKVRPTKHILKPP